MSILPTILVNILDGYRISKKVGYVTSDNIHRNGTAMRRIKQLLRQKGIRFNAEWRRVRCIGHVLNLVARTLLFGHDVDAIEARTQVLQNIFKSAESAA